MQSIQRGGGPLSERRAHRRVRLSARAELHAGAQLSRVDLVDLSLGGVGLTSDARPPVGAEVELRMHVAGGELAISGEVVRSQPGSIGLRFVRLDQRALSSILGLVARA